MLIFCLTSAQLSDYPLSMSVELKALAEYPHLAHLPHCEFLRAFDENETEPEIIMFDSFCGLTTPEESLMGPNPCQYPCGQPGFEKCEGRAKHLSDLTSRSGGK